MTDFADREQRQLYDGETQIGDLEAEIEAQKTADQKRWMNFLKKALGQDQDSQGSHRSRSP